MSRMCGWVCKEIKGKGKPETKKAGISPSPLRYDRFMQDCLGPAHGMHIVIRSDKANYRYSSKEGAIPKGVRFELMISLSIRKRGIGKRNSVRREYVR